MSEAITRHLEFLGRPKAKPEVDPRYTAFLERRAERMRAAGYSEEEIERR